MHIAVIGAGAAGLASARHLTSSEFGYTCEIFEQTDQIGGTWVYTDEIGVGKCGIPVHTSMYNGLVTNLPKEIMNFPDFQFPNYEQSYITQEQVLKYLNDYTIYYNIKPLIKFQHLVKRIHPEPDQKWSVTIRNLCTEIDTEKKYDAVVICNGHYSKPILPKIQGEELFQGKKLHSHFYRKSETFQDQTVLVVGAGPSGVDIALKLIKNASKIFLSHRRAQMRVVFPPKIIVKPATVSFNKTGAVFSDNTTETIDAVIYCTGYEFSFPFLTKECAITVENNYVQPLYKHLLNIEHQTMAFIGIPFLVSPFPLFDYQIRFFLKHLKGTVTLPSNAEMQQDTANEIAVKKTKNLAMKYYHALGKDFQETYFTELAKLAQLQPLAPVKIKIYNDCSMKIRRDVIYKIIDDENFEKIVPP